LQGTPIKSLTPKLVGRTALKAEDVDILIRLFLSHWRYIGDPLSGTITAPSSALYEPMLPDAQIDEVSAYVTEQIQATGAETRSSAEPGRPSSPLGEDMSDLIVKEFREADAMFVVGAGRTMLVAEPETALVNFRNLMNRLWEIERGDQRGRMLIWMLDLGRQRFDDLESRNRFMNVEEVHTRFRALKRLKETMEDVAEARWNWLRSKAAIILHDTSSRPPAGSLLPTFDANHVLFSAVPPRWVGSATFRTLYDVDVSKANYTIFLRKLRPPEQRGPSRGPAPGARQRYELCYFGHTVIPAEEKSGAQLRGLPLDSPGESYTEALGTVFVAAARLLDLPGVPTEISVDELTINQTNAKEKLRHQGFLLLTLTDFMAF
jgi:hypothetical protein